MAEAFAEPESGGREELSIKVALRKIYRVINIKNSPSEDALT